MKFYMIRRISDGFFMYGRNGSFRKRGKRTPRLFSCRGHAAQSITGFVLNRDEYEIVEMTVEE